MKIFYKYEIIENSSVKYDIVARDFYGNEKTAIIIKYPLVNHFPLEFVNMNNEEQKELIDGFIDISTIDKMPFCSKNDNAPDYDLWYLATLVKFGDDSLYCFAVFKNLKLIGTECYPSSFDVDQQYFVTQTAQKLYDEYQNS